MKLPQAFKKALTSLGLAWLPHESPPHFVAIPGPRTVQRQKTLSWWQLELSLRCRRCFWLMKHHGVRLPQTFPPALHHALDGLLKAEFDAYRKRRTLHPILKEAGIPARLFHDLDTLRRWRSPTQWLRWTDPATGYTLHATVHDLLEFPGGSVAVLDYKSSAARDVTLYPSYQLQIDVATFLLQRMGYRTAPKAYLAFFTATRTKGFHGRLPFQGHVVTVSTKPTRVFRRAVTLAQSNEIPPLDAQCDLCRWFGEATRALASAPTPPPLKIKGPSPRTNGRLLTMNVKRRQRDLKMRRAFDAQTLRNRVAAV